MKRILLLNVLLLLSFSNLFSQPYREFDVLSEEVVFLEGSSIDLYHCFNVGAFKTVRIEIIFSEKTHFQVAGDNIHFDLRGHDRVATVTTEKPDNRLCIKINGGNRLADGSQFDIIFNVVAVDFSNKTFIRQYIKKASVVYRAFGDIDGSGNPSKRDLRIMIKRLASEEEQRKPLRNGNLFYNAASISCSEPTYQDFMMLVKMLGEEPGKWRKKLNNKKKS